MHTRYGEPSAPLTHGVFEGREVVFLPRIDTPSAEKAARTLLERGAQHVIVTLGSRGSLIVNKDSSTHVDTFKVDVVDTTAAGDAFIGGFAVSLDSSSWLDAVRYACACGALATTRFGAQPSLPTKEDVEIFIRAKIPKG